MKHSIHLAMGAGALAVAALGCTVDEVPGGLRRTPSGPGNTVRFDLYHKPLPEIPLPNDVAMWPDPTSRTGLRINASLVAPTDIESIARAKFDTLEGWGTFSPITVSFDREKSDDPRPAIDLENIVRRHQGDDYELADDAVYVVDLDTGIPAVLDVGEGAFQFIVREKHKYWRNDTRVTESNLLFETADEAVNPETGLFDEKRTVYAPELDTDFDGTLDRPNLLDPDGPPGNHGSCPSQVDVRRCDPNTQDCAALEADRDRCIADQLLTWYERETDTLIARPLVPLREKTRYAVVVTDRVVDYDGHPVKSPFDFVYHPSQVEAIAKLEKHLENPELASYYGDLGGTGLDHVAFAWAFTTQPVIEDLRLIRDGLYGKGPFARLAKRFPAEPTFLRASGRLELDEIEKGTDEGRWWEHERCRAGQPPGTDRRQTYYVVDLDLVQDILPSLANQAFGFSGNLLRTLTDGFAQLRYLVIGTVKSPFFIEGGPTGEDPTASFGVDFEDAEGEMAADEVQFLLAIPRERPGHTQPFPVAMYGHGYTSAMIEHLGFAGELAKQGIASLGWNAVYHGLDLSQEEKDLAGNLFSYGCEAPFGGNLFRGRQRDLDDDGELDSGGDYWSAYLFHTRDVVRQSTIDSLQILRALKQLGTRTSKQDYDQDGDTDELLGDFDGNGVPDVGGPDVEYYAWGQSLGGILAPATAALDPDVVAASPTSGSGGLLDVGVRTFQGGAFEGIYLLTFGPLVVGVPADQLGDDTVCDPGQVSLRYVVLSVNDAREVEVHCLDTREATGPSGGTVFVDNLTSGETRCARVDASGRFRVGLPSTVGDRVAIRIYGEPDAVDTYDHRVGCNVVGDAERIALVDTFGEGAIAKGTLDPTGRTNDVVCEADGGCTKFQQRYFPEGAPLVAIAEGFGFIRQTPSLRRFLALGGQVVDGGDPINYAPYFGLETMLDPEGNPHPATGLLNIVTIGDMNVPLNSGVAMARAAGAVPFLRPDAAERYPALADYVTPSDLYSQLGERTANRYLLDHDVLEGIGRLRRHPADPCGTNEVPMTAEVTECHRACSSNDGCDDGQVCNDDGRCARPPVDPARCAEYLADVDVLDEGMATWGELEAPMPLRVARVATRATPETIDDVWEPRLRGAPFGSDQGAWAADRRVVASLAGYILPRGEHGYFVGNPCDAFPIDTYLVNLTTRFFATGGADLYYLSHPASHQCLAWPQRGGGCDFVEALPPPKPPE